jgi:hypothetical protein
MKTTLKLHPMHPKNEQTDSPSATISNDSSKMAETYGFAGAKKPAQGPVSGSFLPETTTTQATGTAPVTTEVKTTVYTADLGDRTEGNQNWGETGGEFGSRTSQSSSDMAQKAKLVGQQAADSAKQTASNVADSAYNAKETVKDNAYYAKESAKDTANRAAESASQTAASLKESASQTAASAKESAAETSASMQSKWEQGKEKLGQVAETAKEKAYHASEIAGEKYQQTKVAAEHNLEVGKERLGETYDATLHKTQDATQSVKEGTHGLIDRVKETAGNTATVIQQKSHDLVEQAQHTLEAAREKAREVFAGAQQDVSTTTTSKDTLYVKPGETVIGGTPEVDVKVKTTDTTGDIDRVKVQTTTTQ